MTDRTAGSVGYPNEVNRIYEWVSFAKLGHNLVVMSGSFGTAHRRLQLEAKACGGHCSGSNWQFI